MAFHHRKILLPADDDPKVHKKYISCESCSNDCPEPCKENNYNFPSNQKPQMPTILIIVLCILAAGFVFLSYLAVSRYRSRNSRRRRSLPSAENANAHEDFVDENQGPLVDHHIWYIRTIGLPREVIDSILVFEYKRNEGLTESTDCSVCLNEFQEDDRLRLLPKCSHAFHLSCIDTWLRAHQNCPVCRAAIVSGITITNTNQMNLAGTNSHGPDPRGEVRMHHTLEPPVEEEGEPAGGYRVGIQNVVTTSTQDRKLDSVIPGSIDGNLRVLSDLADHRMEVAEELPQVRRSLSMDFSSASTIYNVIAEIHAKKHEGSDPKLVMIEEVSSGNRRINNSSLYGLIKSASFGRSRKRVPISMKRSFSCGVPGIAEANNQYQLPA